MVNFGSKICLSICCKTHWTGARTANKKAASQGNEGAIKALKKLGEELKWNPKRKLLFCAVSFWLRFWWYLVSGQSRAFCTEFWCLEICRCCSLWMIYHVGVALYCRSCFFWSREFIWCYCRRGGKVSLLRYSAWSHGFSQSSFLYVSSEGIYAWRSEKI